MVCGWATCTRSVLTISEDKRRGGLRGLVALVHLADREEGVGIQPT